MKNWTKQNLGDEADIIMGQSPESKYYNKNGEGLPFFQGVKDFGKKYPVEKVWTTYTNKTADVGDILFSVRAPVGDINIAQKKSALGRGVCAIRSKNGQNEFLYFLLKNNCAQIINIGNGAVYDAINKPSLEKISLIFPDLPMRKRIGGVLAAYDDLIENNEKRIRILEEMAQRLYTEWFVKFNFPGHEKVKMIDSGTEYGMIPEGWKVNKLRDVAGYVRGCSYSSDEIDDFIGEYYIVNLKSFNRGGGFRFDGAKYYTGDVNENQLLSEDDIVVAVTDMTNDRAVIARPARIPEIKYKTTLSADVVKIISDILPNSFIYQLLSSYRFTETTKHKANGANVLHLKPDSILEYKALIPTKDLMTKFDVLCSKMAHEINKLINQTEISVKTRDILIPRLVTGKLEIK